MDPYEAVMWGCLGGILPDVLRLVGLRYGDVPNYLKQGFFWLSLVLLVAVAGLAAYLLAPQRIVDAVTLGFSAPEILSTALGTKKPPSGGPPPADRGSVAAETQRPSQGGGASNALVQLRHWWAN
jgi:hypothetical protein